MEKISSVQEYVQIVENCYNRLLSEKSLHQTIGFRGQSDCSFCLSPYLQRFGVSKEEEVIQLAKTSYPHVFLDSYSPLVLLSVLQHYGIPTRLMDITKNALVGLYFACNENFDKDGKVYVFGYEETPALNDTSCDVIAGMYLFFHGKEMIPVQEFLSSVARKKETFFSLLEDEEWKKKVLSRLQTVNFIHLPHLIYRQTAQAGHYILFSNRMQGDALLSEILPLPEESPYIKEQILVSASAKRLILDELEYFGVTEMNLFPENIDKGCRWIRRKVGHRQPLQKSFEKITV